MDNNTQTTQDNTQPVQASSTIPLIVTAVIAVAVLAFAAYLFAVGQAGVGAALAGGVVAHYFSMANGTTASNNVLTGAATVGRMVAPAQTVVVQPAPAPAQTTQPPMSAGGQ